MKSSPVEPVMVSSPAPPMKCSTLVRSSLSGSLLSASAVPVQAPMPVVVVATHKLTVKSVVEVRP
jgi:hypothetical protein